MKQASSWSIRDVPPEAREWARAVANREGMSVADWLARRIINDSAQPDASGRDEPAGKAQVTQGGSDDASSGRVRIDDALAALGRLVESNKHAQEYASRAMEGVATEIEAATRGQTALLQSLVERVDSLEHQTSNAVRRNGDMSGRLESLDSDLESVAKQISTAREDSQRLSLFIQEQLSTFAERVRSTESRTVHYPELEGAVMKLSDTHATTARKLDDMAGAMEKLTGDLRGAREISERVARTIQERVESVTARMNSAELRLSSFPQMESNLARLTTRDTETAGQIGTIAASVEKLAGDIASTREDTVRLGSTIQDRLSTVAERIRAQETRTQGYPQIEQSVANLNKRHIEITSLIDLISDNIDKLGDEIFSVREDSAGVGEAIQDRVAAIAASMQLAEERLKTFPRIEEAVSRLSDRDLDNVTKLGTLTGSLQKLVARVAAAEERLARHPHLEEALTKLGERDTENSDRIGKLSGAFERLTSELRSVREGSVRLSSTVQQQLGAISERVQSAEATAARTAQVEKTVGKLTAQAAESAQRVGALSGNADQMASELRTVRKLAEEARAAAANSDTADRVGKLEGDVAAFGAIREESTRLGASLQEQLDAIVERLHSAEVQLDNTAHIEETLAELAPKIAEAAGQIGALAGNVDKLGKDVRSAREDTSKIGATIDDKINAFVRSMPSGDASLSHTDDAIAELRMRLNTLEQSAKNAGGIDAASIKRNLEAIDARLAKNERQADGFDKTRQALASFEQTLAATQEENRKALGQLQAGVEKVTKRLSVLEAGSEVAHPEPEFARTAAPAFHADEEEAAPEPVAPPPLLTDLNLSHDTEMLLSQETPLSGSSPLAESGYEAFSQTFDPATPETPSLGPNYLTEARRAAKEAFDQTAIKDARGGRTASGESPSRLRQLAIAAAVLVALGSGAVWMMRGFVTDTVETVSTPATEASFGTQPQAQIQVAPPAAQPNTQPGQVSAFDQVKAKADMGDAKAMLALGVAYADGTGVAGDENEAKSWLQRAADAGEAVAQYRLGVRFERGVGVAKDPMLALNWYTQAAEKGNRSAMHNLAVILANGSGVPKNPAEAIRWFKTAAGLGLTDSQFNLAVLYEHGLGVKQSLSQAYTWYTIAGANGDAEAKSRSDALATQIKPAEKVAAEREVAAFMPQMPKPEANEVPTLAQLAAP